MHQTFLQSEGLNIAVQFWVLEVFVDVEKTNSLWSVVTIYCLQTGDVVKEGRSGEAAED